MYHQDFKEIVFHNVGKNGKNGGSSSATTPKVVVSKLQKELMQEEGDVPKLKMFGKDNAKTLQAARTMKNLTQEQLANQINEKKLIINQYETGNVVPDPKILSKLRKVLNVKFK